MKNDVRLNLVVHRKLLQWFSIDLKKKRKEKGLLQYRIGLWKKTFFLTNPIWMDQWNFTLWCISNANMTKMETATKMKNTERILAIKLLEDPVLVKVMETFFVFYLMIQMRTRNLTLKQAIRLKGIRRHLNTNFILNFSEKIKKICVYDHCNENLSYSKTLIYMISWMTIQNKKEFHYYWVIKQMWTEAIIVLQVTEFEHSINRPIVMKIRASWNAWILREARNII